METDRRCFPSCSHCSVEWAARTINQSFWAGNYYRLQRAKGSLHQAALAFKWIRILYRCGQLRFHMMNRKYFHALKRRRSPLLNAIVQVANLLGKKPQSVKRSIAQ
jgi:hypothetical protein